METPILIAIVAACSSIISAAISAYVSYRIAKRHERVKTKEYSIKYLTEKIQAIERERERIDTEGNEMVNNKRFVDSSIPLMSKALVAVALMIPIHYNALKRISHYIDSNAIDEIEEEYRILSNTLSYIDYLKTKK